MSRHRSGRLGRESLNCNRVDFGIQESMGQESFEACEESSRQAGDDRYLSVITIP